MRQRLAMGLGALMIAGGMLGASLTFGAGGLSVDAQEGTPPVEERSEAHERMDEVMDEVMGEGASERMHAAMPESEEMMEACAAGMDGMMNGMMNGGMDDMMNGGMHESDGTPTTEEGR